MWNIADVVGQRIVAANVCCVLHQRATDPVSAKNADAGRLDARRGRGGSGGYGLDLLALGGNPAMAAAAATANNYMMASGADPSLVSGADPAWMLRHAGMPGLDVATAMSAAAAANTAGSAAAGDDEFSSMHSLDGRFTLVTDSCWSVLGYEPSFFIGRNFYALTHPEDTLYLANLHQRILGREPSQKILLRMFHIQQYYVPIEMLMMINRNPQDLDKEVLMCCFKLYNPDQQQQQQSQNSLTTGAAEDGTTESTGLQEDSQQRREEDQLTVLAAAASHTADEDPSTITGLLQHQASLM